MYLSDILHQWSFLFDVLSIINLPMSSNVKRVSFHRRTVMNLPTVPHPDDITEV